nr:hypothetical protein [Tanacetum cinerariifolium]
GVRSFEFAIDSYDSLLDRFEPSRSRETELEMDVDVADALRARRIDDRDVVEVVDRDEVEMGARGPVEVRFDRVTHLVIADDIPKPAQEEGVVEVTYETLERIKELEWVNMRLRDMMDVASQRVTRSQFREFRVQRELRQIRRFRFYDRIRIARLEACANRHLGYHS